jgi:hypothetical protein
MKRGMRIKLLRVCLAAGYVALTLAGCERTNSPTGVKKSNYSIVPPTSYSGKWVVAWTNTDRIWIEAHYVHGVKEGIEARWYRDSGSKMSIHTFTNGVLEGKAVKYRNHSGGSILAEGVFKSGQPWDGTFLVALDGAITKLDVDDQDTPYWVLEYREGIVLRRFEKP